MKLRALIEKFSTLRSPFCHKISHVPRLAFSRNCVPLIAIVQEQETIPTQKNHAIVQIMKIMWDILSRPNNWLLSWTGKIVLGLLRNCRSRIIKCIIKSLFYSNDLLFSFYFYLHNKLFWFGIKSYSETGFVNLAV